MLTALALAVPMTAWAKLPPPTPAEQDRLEQQKAAKAAATEQDKKELAQVQDRIVKRYRTRHPDYAAAHPAVRTNAPLTDADVPKAARVPGPSGQPHSGRNES
ncbi:MAG TPA: hypothetical protein VI319_06575 [Burkholderiales bacterium]